VNGRETYSKVLIPSLEGENIFAIDLENRLSPGIYLVVATSKKDTYRKKLIVR